MFLKKCEMSINSWNCNNKYHTVNIYYNFFLKAVRSFQVIISDLHRSAGIYFTAEENSGKPSDEGCATSHRLKWGPLHPNEVDRIAQHVRKGEGRKEEKGIKGPEDTT